MTTIKSGTTAVAILPAGFKLVLSPSAFDVAEAKGVKASTGSRGSIERYIADPDSAAWTLVKTSQLVADPAPSYTYGEFPYDVKLRVVCEAGGYSYSWINVSGAENAGPVEFKAE